MKLSDFLKKNEVYEEFVNKFDKDYDSRNWKEDVERAICSAFVWGLKDINVYNQWNGLDSEWHNLTGKENDMLWLLDDNSELRNIEKVIDFNNVYCVASKENTQALIEKGFYMSDSAHMNDFSILIIFDNKGFYRHIKPKENTKKIEYKNNEWYYVKNEDVAKSDVKSFEKDNNFEVKEKDLYKHKKGSIYKVIDKELSLYKETIIFYKKIDSDREYCRTISHFRESFTPYQLEWHDIEENFPALVKFKVNDKYAYDVVKYKKDSKLWADNVSFLSGSISSVEFIAPCKTITERFENE